MVILNSYVSLLEGTRPSRSSSAWWHHSDSPAPDPRDATMGPGSKWNMKQGQESIKNANNVQLMHIHWRRKFRSQMSDNMDGWKAEVVRVKEEKRREEKRRAEQRREEKRSEAKRSEAKRSEGKGREEKRREEKRSEAKRSEEKRREEKRSDERRGEERRGEERRGEEKRRSEKRKSEERVRRKSQKKEDADARKR